MSNCIHTPVGAMTNDIICWLAGLLYQHTNFNIVGVTSTLTWKIMFLFVQIWVLKHVLWPLNLMLLLECERKWFNSELLLTTCTDQPLSFQFICFWVCKGIYKHLACNPYQYIMKHHFLDEQQCFVAPRDFCFKEIFEESILQHVQNYSESGECKHNQCPTLLPSAYQ